MMDPDAPQPPSTLKRLGPLAWVGLIASTLPPLGSIVLLTKIEAVSQWLRSSEALGPAVYIAGFSVCAGLALLPTYATAVLGGWAFGWVIGLPCAMLGFTGASLIAYAIGRRVSGDRVHRILADKPKWNTIARALFGSGRGKTLLIVSLVRLPPNSPFALANLVLASVGVPLPIYLLGTFLGMLPRTAAVVYAASHLQQLSFEDGADWRYFAAGIAMTIGVLWVLWYISKRALARMTVAPDDLPPG